jgi:catechol 2,3-dioxygenase-like lactoylglutathione lyase family enzyme
MVASPNRRGRLLHRTAKSRAGITPHGLSLRQPIARFRRVHQQVKSPPVPSPEDIIAGNPPGRALKGWPWGNATGKLPHPLHEQPKPTPEGSREKQAMPTVTWDHVHLRSPDPEATAAWLRDILGGEIVRSPGRIDVKLGGANVFIAPVTAGDGVHTPPVTPYQGLDHFGLTVRDIDAVAAEIKAKGVEFTKEPTTIRPGVRICFIRGPQGISVELLERDKKYA